GSGPTPNQCGTISSPLLVARTTPLPLGYSNKTNRNKPATLAFTYSFQAEPTLQNLARDISVPRTPQQNGIAEKKNRTLIEAARTMALVTKPHNKTPYELLHGRKPSIGFVRPFGCPMTILNTLYSLGKFDGKVDEEFLVGYSVSSKAFRVFNSRTRIAQETLHNTDGDAAFDEKEPEFNEKKHETEVNVSPSSSAQSKKHDDKTKREAKGKSHVESFTGYRNLSAEFEDFFDNNINEDNVAGTLVPAVGQISPNSTNTFSVDGTSNVTASPTHGKSSCIDSSQLPDDPDMPELEDITYSDDEDDVGAEADFNNLETSITVNPIPTTKIHKDHPVTQIIGDLSSATQTMSIKMVAKDQGGLLQINNEDFHTCMFVCFLSQEEPKRVHQALKDLSWIEAMQEELLQFKMQKVWVLVDFSNKARLVAQGHTQEERIDYEEVFAPVARIEAIRLFLAYASFMGFMVYQIDVKSAFMYGTIEEEVYVCQPPGFEDPDYPDKVYKVVKALYGLHQAPRAWYETLTNYLLENGFQRGKIDQTLFIKRHKGDILLVQIYVNDIIFGSTNKDSCKAFEKLMKDKFQVSSMGELTFFLGLQVKKKKDGIFISQDKYVAEILRKSGLTNGKSASTPIDTEKPLLKDPDGEDVDVHIYRSMIGSLMYLTSSRPDIMFAVYACARFQVTPKASHLHVVKMIFRYLKGKPHLGLWYPKDSPFDLVAYSDSDYAGASLDRKSTTRGCQFFGCRLISWQCKKQTVVATSSIEAEYVAAASCYAQVLWIQNQLLDYGMEFLKRMVHVTNILSAGYLTTPQMVLNSPCLTYIKNWLVQIKRSLSWLVQKQTALGVNTPRSDEDMIELMELMVFLLPSDKKVGVEVSAVDLQTSVAVKKVNDVMRLQALVDKKKVVITEATCMSAKRTSWNEFSSSMASAVICLSSGRKFNFSKYIFDSFVKGFLELKHHYEMIVEQQVVEGADEVHDEGVHAASIVVEGVVGAASDDVNAAVAEPSIPSPTPPTPPPQPSHDIPSTSQDAGIFMNLLQDLIDTCTTLTRRVEHLELDKIAQALKITKLKQRVEKLEMRNKLKVLKLRRLKRVGSAQRIDTSDDTVMDDVSKQEGIIKNIDADEDVVLEDAKDVAADPKDGQDTDIDENAEIQGRTTESQAQIYKIDLEHANKVLSMQDEEESKPAELQEVVNVVTTAKTITEVVTTASTTITAAGVPVPAATTAAAPSRKTNGVVIRDPEETTTTYTIIHSKAKSKDKGKGILAKEDNTVKRYQALKRKPQTEAQARKNMMIYLKNVAGFKMDYFKGMSYDDIRPVFEKYFDSNIKEQMDEEDSRALKRLNESQEEKAAKKQKLEEEVEELKRHLQIVPNDEDDVYTEATLLARKVSVVDYEIYNQNNKPYFKIKRADGLHQLYLSFLSLLRNFDREDLEALWSLVKEYRCPNLEESKKCSGSSKSQELEAVGVLWCADNHIYNNTLDFDSRKEISTHKVHSESDA
nr:putative ribonuclease H-like domain-containing protein [Tanacetum cinerariifolium]